MKDKLAQIEKEAGFITVEDEILMETASIFPSGTVIRCVMPMKIAAALGIADIKQSTSAVWINTPNEVHEHQKISDLHKRQIKHVIVIPTKKVFRKNK